MQTLEAMISLVFFIWAATLAVSSYDSQPPDDSLYRLQLAGDAWRVLYLRGELQDVSDIKSLEPAIDEIGRQSGLCLFIEGIEATSCRGGTISHEISVSLPRTLIVGGAPKRVTLSLGI
jgi:hypothetical protein